MEVLRSLGKLERSEPDGAAVAQTASDCAADAYLPFEIAAKAGGDPHLRALEKLVARPPCRPCNNLTESLARERECALAARGKGRLREELSYLALHAAGAHIV
eukprot:196198-Pleurochrysis_carterae.AAC.1